MKSHEYGEQSSLRKRGSTTGEGMALSRTQINRLKSSPETAHKVVSQLESDSVEGTTTVVPNTVEDVTVEPEMIPGSISSSRPFNPEQLGAKPKLLLKTKSKSLPKHRAHRDIPSSVCSNMNNLNYQETSAKKKPNKLGVKISPSDIQSSEIVPPESNSFQDNSKFSWSGDSNTVNQDLHDPIPPLLDKFTSLDFVEPYDEIGSTFDDRSVWSTWGAWVLNGASSVSNHVSQSLSTVTSAIESGLGAVEPEEMARISWEASNLCPDVLNTGESKAEAPEPASPTLNVMGNVLKFVESTGEMIVTSGINTLETLGKKTMDVLQEGDPGLRKKRAMFFKEPEKPTLSQVLKEAQTKAETEDRQRATARQSAKGAHFEMLFDDYKGMVHLEALEMLSNTCQLKLEAKLACLSGTSLVEFQSILFQIKEQCDVADDEDEGDDNEFGQSSIEGLERELTSIMRNLAVPVSHSKLIRVCEDADAWLATMKCMQHENSQSENDEWVDEAEPQTDLHDIHEQAIRGLAKFAAAVVEHFHKVAELILLKEDRNSQLECQCVVTMTSLICSQVSSVAARYSELLSATANTMDSSIVDHNDVNLLITNIFLEASNSSSYIQEASLLFIPIIQLGAVR